MIINNGEAFIKLDTAAKAYFNGDLMFDDLNKKHYEHLEKYLDLYIHINSICDIYKPAPPPIEYAFSTIPKNIKGMCKAELVNPTLKTATRNSSTAKIKLSTSRFITNIPLELADCVIRPVDNHLSPDNYFSCAFVRLAEFITHAKVTDIEINILFLKPIIINDDSFCTLKEISNKDIDSEFNFKQAANKYFKHFNGVLEQTIIDACEYASNIYDHENKVNDTESIAKTNINEIIKLINEAVPTNEDIELFKSNLPDIWQEALFNNEITKTDTTIIEALKLDIANKNKEIDLLKKDIFPIMTPKLKAALKAQNNFWLSYDENHPPLQKTIKYFIEKELGLNHLKTNRDADELTRAIQPDNIKRK